MFSSLAASAQQWPAATDVPEAHPFWPQRLVCSPSAESSQIQACRSIAKGPASPRITTSLVVMLDLLVRWAKAATEIGRLVAPQSTLAEIATLTGDARLTRSCIHDLARRPQPIVTGQQLTELLPTRLTPRGETKVR